LELVLKVKGEKTVKGSDFKLPSQVELVNKNCHIATLNSRSAELEMEIQIEKGIGYSSRETRKKGAGSMPEKLEIGAILLDASFTPVKRVSSKVENMRVGERTDFDRLFLEIETDGIIDPEQAFFQAADILINHFSLLANAFQPKAAPAPSETKEKKNAVKKPKKEKTSKKAKNEKKKKGKKTK
jgi:DNA-directed RNA polymerase subunit alpha